jgi:cytochrome b561
MLHKYIGFGLSILLLWRIGIEVAVSKEKKLRIRIKNALNYPVETYNRSHYVMVQYIYSIFYLLFFLMAATGLVLAFEDVEWLKPVHNAAKQMHSVVHWGMYGFIIIHLTGVIRADLTKYDALFPE